MALIPAEVSLFLDSIQINIFVIAPMFIVMLKFPKLAPIDIPIWKIINKFRQC